MKKTLILFVIITISVIVFLVQRFEENHYDTLSANSLDNITPLPPTSRPLVGLALGGGGVRGFLHIGVLKALEEAGIRPDVLTGASAGSIVAAFYASGMSTEKISQVADNISYWRLADPVISVQGGSQGQGIGKWVGGIIKNRQIQKLPIPLGVAVTDLNRGKPLLVTKGDTGEAVQASCSIPGTFVPVQNNGNTWVDGAILSVVPTRFAKAMGADIVVGVDIYCGNIPQPKDNALNTVLLAFRHQSCTASKKELAEADILIQPEYEPQNFISLSEKEVAIEAGYTAMKKRLPELIALLTEKKRKY